MSKQIAGLNKVMSQIKSRQIITCKTCHQRIHAGLYDGIKLTDLYDQTRASI